MDPKKDDHSSETKPWDQSFGDDRDDQGNLSRTKRHKQSHNNRLVTIILVAIIILIAVGSLIYGLARQSAMNKPDNSMSVASERTSSVSQPHRKKAAKSVSKKSVSKKPASTSVSEKKTPAADANASSKVSEHSSAKATSAVTTSSQTQQTSEPATAKQPTTHAKPAKSTASQHATSSTSGSGSKYATVGQGQGIYRVAVNNGISVERLKQLNGGLTGQTLRPGQKLRVK